jgi:hypothetical protein
VVRYRKTNTTRTTQRTIQTTGTCNISCIALCEQRKFPTRASVSGHWKCQTVPSCRRSYCSHFRKACLLLAGLQVPSCCESNGSCLHRSVTVSAISLCNSFTYSRVCYFDRSFYFFSISFRFFQRRFSPCSAFLLTLPSIDSCSISAALDYPLIIP